MPCASDICAEMKIFFFSLHHRHNHQRGKTNKEKERKMSEEDQSPWQAYTDGLIATGAMVSCTIVGLADCAYWAYTGDHVPQPEEAQHIVDCLKDPTKARMSGVRIAGNKYFVMRAEPELLMGKLGNGGMVIIPSQQAAIIAVFGGDAQPAFGALKEVEQLATSFKEAGY